MERPPEPSSKIFCMRPVIGAMYEVVTGLYAPWTRVMNISKRKSVSVGPAHASGWNCTEKMFFVEWMSPSFEPSLALTKSCW